MKTEETINWLDSCIVCAGRQERRKEGMPRHVWKFETDKAKLRHTIRTALSKATSFDEFSSLLLREGVTVRESRGRLSYLTPDRTKPITARKLGDDFDRTAVFSCFERNAARTMTQAVVKHDTPIRAAEKTAAIVEYPDITQLKMPKDRLTELRNSILQIRAEFIVTEKAAS